MLTSNGYDERVVARLLEFWGRDTPWQRSLWMIGTGAALDEVIEASVAVSAGVLSEKTLKGLQAEVHRTAGEDPGVGELPTRRVLGRLLDNQTDLSANRVGWHSLSQLLDPIKSGYLGRWAEAISAEHAPGVERAARYIAGHVRSAGFSKGYLHRWLTYQSVHRSDALTLGDVLREAESDLIARKPRAFQVVIPCQAAALADTSESGAWKGPAEIAQRIEEIHGKRASIRQGGGFILEVKALDAESAVDQALEQVSRWTARLELATNRTVVVGKHVWVAARRTPYRPHGGGEASTWARWLGRGSSTHLCPTTKLRTVSTTHSISSSRWRSVLELLQSAGDGLPLRLS